MRSGTNFYIWGAMFLYINKSHSVPYYIDHIVHECAHTALNILNAEDEFVLNSRDELFNAPLRKDKRPMIGLFHALFVLNRICYTFEKCLLSSECDYKDEIKHRLQENISKLKETYKTVRDYAKTTDLGENILCAIRDKWIKD